MAFNIVLVEPEIPQNAGNVIRTCAAAGAALYFVRPLGFLTDEKHFRRAGLDYFDRARINYRESFSELKEEFPDSRFFYVTTKGGSAYTENAYCDGDFFVFGKESAGLPEPLLERNYDSTIRIPMLDGIRSLNLSNSVAIVLYEALRQTGFCGFVPTGVLTGRGW